MTQISFGKKKSFATSEATRIETSGIDVSHMGSKDAIYIQATVMAADQLFKTGVGIGIPADPVYIDKLITELTKLKQQLTPSHVR